MVHQDLEQEKNTERSRAIILLDADQLTIDRDTEIQLEKRTHSQILYRIAFANWKIKNNDRVLHERHYLLIHLPAGRDKADGGMIMFGSSIREHYPDVNCIFICSNDQIFISLATRVIQLGLQAYRINQIGQEIHVKSLDGIESWMIRPSIPIATLLSRVKDIIEKEASSGWILMKSIENSYQRNYGINFEDDLKEQPEYHSLLEFLQHYPKHFVVHSVNLDRAEIYISCFHPPLETEQAQIKASEGTQGTQSLDKPVETIDKTNDHSQKVNDFEQKVIQAIRSLLSDPSTQRLDNDFFSLLDVSKSFQNLYKLPINQACLQATTKRIGLALSRQLLKQLKTQKQGNMWWMGLRK